MPGSIRPESSISSRDEYPRSSRSHAPSRAPSNAPSLTSQYSRSTSGLSRAPTSHSTSHETSASRSQKFRDLAHQQIARRNSREYPSNSSVYSGATAHPVSASGGAHSVVSRSPSTHSRSPSPSTHTSSPRPRASSQSQSGGGGALGFMRYAAGGSQVSRSNSHSSSSRSSSHSPRRSNSSGGRSDSSERTARPSREIVPLQDGRVSHVSRAPPPDFGRTVLLDGLVESPFQRELIQEAIRRGGQGGGGSLSFTETTIDITYN